MICWSLLVISLFSFVNACTETEKGNVTLRTAHVFQSLKAQSLPSCKKLCCENINCSAILINATNFCHFLQCSEFEGNVSCKTFPKDEKLLGKLFLIKKDVCSVKKCLNNSVCAVQDDKAVCVCNSGYTKDLKNPDSCKLPEKILVSCGENKTITLPQTTISIDSTVLPPDSDSTYTYEWNLLSSSSKNKAVLENNQRSSVKLLNLTPGIYRLQLTVKGPGFLAGHGYINITVLPETRSNAAPKAVIEPAKTTVKLPQDYVVLNGQSSSDDVNIVKHQWKELRRPANAKPLEFQTDEMLQKLSNLVAGEYIVSLTVWDAEGLNSTMSSNITVVGIADYPPVADAGGDVIVNLPVAYVSLNGSRSTDDHLAALKYQWSRDTSTGGTADLSGSDTPFLKISHLEEGTYSFTLTVTDSAGQSNDATVRVIVQKPKDEPPVAFAGKPITITLPDSSTILNGSLSKDDKPGKLIYRWNQTSGPVKGELESPSKPVTRVNGLNMEGEYVFQLRVWDTAGQLGVNMTKVKVSPNSNKPPVAVLGSDFEVFLPCSLIEIDGSKSTDDVSIISWKWSVDGQSPGFGSIINPASSVMRFVNPVEGIYHFILRVEDSSGLFDEQSVGVTVKAVINASDIVEIRLSPMPVFFQHMRISFIRHVAVALDVDEKDINVTSLRKSDVSGEVVIFIVVAHIRAAAVCKALRAFLSTTHSHLGRMRVDLVDTMICTRSCSGHGRCNRYTKECECDSWWLGSECSYSLLYIVLGILFLFALIVLFLWLNYRRFSCKTVPSQRFKRHRRTNRYNKFEEKTLMLPKRHFSDSDESEEGVYFKSNSEKIEFQHQNGALLQ